MKRDGLFKSSRHELLELSQPPEPAAWVKPSARASYRACDTGPCHQGKKLCPSPDACRLAEQAERRASGSLRQVVWLAALAIGASILTGFRGVGLESGSRMSAHLDDMPTTKRFARSTLEAFPRSAEYGAAIEAPAPHESLARRAVEAVRWILALALLAAMLTSPHWWAR